MNKFEYVLRGRIMMVSKLIKLEHVWGEVSVWWGETLYGDPPAPPPE